MDIDLNIEISINTSSEFSKKEKDELISDLKNKIKTNTELLLDDIPIPDHTKLLDGYDYEIFVDEV